MKTTISCLKQFLLVCKLFIGDSGVGKSNILSQFVKSQFSLDTKTTIGVQFASKTIVHKNKTLKIQVWDTAGQQRYRSMASAYYRGYQFQQGASGAFLVYDISRYSSFQNIQKWLKQLKNYSDDNLVSMMIGNKSDLRHLRSVKGQLCQQEQLGEQFSLKNNMAFLQTSAMNRDNIDQAFEQMIKHIFEIQVQKRGKKNVQKDEQIKKGGEKLQMEKDQKDKKKCC